MDKNYTCNGNTEEKEFGILHKQGSYWITNEGTKNNPNYHVWKPGVTHAVCDSSYSDISLAVARCNYISKINKK